MLYFSQKNKMIRLLDNNTELNSIGHHQELLMDSINNVCQIMLLNSNPLKKWIRILKLNLKLVKKGSQ